MFTLPEGKMFPRSFEEACQIEHATHSFDKDTKERFVTRNFKAKTFLKCMESGITTVRFFKETSIEDTYGLKILSSNEIKEQYLIKDASGKLLIKASIPNLLWYTEDDKTHGFTPKNNDLTLEYVLGSESFIFQNTKDTHYTSPDSKLRKERKLEVEELIQRYKLEHLLHPKDTNKIIKDYKWSQDVSHNWKELLEANEGLQYRFAYVNTSHRLSELIHRYIWKDYLVAVNKHPTEYIQLC